MATNAYGQDFWIGKVFQSKDKRDGWRHVVIADIKNGRAKCHRLLYGELTKMNSRGSWISLKGISNPLGTVPRRLLWLLQRNASVTTKPINLTVNDHTQTRNQPCHIRWSVD
jgi:hypothetical protein